MAVAAPLILVVAVGFAAFCLFDLVRIPEARYLPKWVWALIICVSIPLGGIVYLAAGRGRVEQLKPPIAHAHSLPPGDSHAVISRGPARSVPPPAWDGAGSIEVERLTKRFGSTTAVEDLTFTVRPGHVTGFLGPNGAGKTTTMRVILGLEAPSAGSTRVRGRRYQDIVQPLHEVGTLLDAGAAHPGRSARLHILSIAQSNGIGRSRVEEVLELTGLGSVAHRRVQQFSLGMKQRLGIATALLGDPPILLFDEPVNGLDPEGIRWVRQLFKSLAAEDRTVFVSSHLMSEMALTADHLIIIGRGRLLADTATEAFVEANAHKDVFVRSPRAGELRQDLLRAGANVVADGDDTLSVTGVDAPAIAEIAAAHQIPIHELTPRYASLEEAYLDLTGTSVEYRAGNAGDQAEGAGR
jgi:ABC-2 type transport system ATP-binding protein